MDVLISADFPAISFKMERGVKNEFNGQYNEI